MKTYLMVAALFLVLSSAHAEGPKLPGAVTDFLADLNNLPFTYGAQGVQLASGGAAGERLGQVVGDAISAKMSGDSLKLKSSIQAVSDIQKTFSGAQNYSVIGTALNSILVELKSTGVCLVSAQAQIQDPHQGTSTLQVKDFLWIDDQGNGQKTLDFSWADQGSGDQKDLLASILEAAGSSADATVKISGNVISLSYQGLSYSNQQRLPIQGGSASFVDGTSGMTVSESAQVKCSSQFPSQF